MSWTNLAIVLTVVMGGIIAYFGDWIGRKVGKRRTRIRNLRPKHSAIIITMVTGAAVSLLTIIALFALVSPVRLIILDGEKAIRSSADLRAKNDKLNREQNALLIQQKAAEADLQKTTSQLNSIQQELNTQNNKLKTAQTNLKAVQERRNALAGQLVAAAARLVAVQKQYASLKLANSKLEKGNKDLNLANNKLALANVELNETNTKLTNKNNDLNSQNTQLVSKNNEYTERNLSLERLNIELEKTNKTLLSQSSAYSRIIETNKLRIESLNTTRQQLEAENQQLIALVNNLTPGYNSIRDAFLAARNGRVAIQKDEDLARIVIPRNSSPEEVRKLLGVVLHDASESAKRKGATSENNPRAVQVVNRQVVEKRPDGKLVTLEVTPEDRLDAVVSKLSYSSTPIGVLVLAVSNSVYGEPAAIDFQPFPNRLVYNKGAVVLQSEMNGDDGSEVLFNAVSTFLQKMGKSAVTNGIIPRFDPATGEMQTGSLQGSEVVKIVEKLRDLSGKVRLKAVARHDLFSADSLDIDFIYSR